MNDDLSPLQSQRMQFFPKLPSGFMDLASVCLEPAQDTMNFPNELKELFPYGSNLPLMKRSKEKEGLTYNLRIGVVFSGGQAPGGHNVVAGLWDALEKLGTGELVGFMDGPSGILSGKYKTLLKEEVDVFRNTGGFDLLGSGRTKIETETQFKQALEVCSSLKLDGLVIVGGDDSNTNAALLSEYFHKEGSSICVVGVPKTIDGDLQNSYVPLSFGFDTASRVYAELIGNLEKDALSAKKYYHFVRVMGRSASHLALECALLTHPNLTLISEEAFAQKTTLKEIVETIKTLVLERSALGKSYGVILIPEGLIECLPDVSALIQELNLLVSPTKETTPSEVLSKLSQESKECFSLIPESIQKQMLLGLDPHGNVQVSLIETERLLAERVHEEMKNHKEVSFHALTHFFGYEGRAAFPSNFDATYCYSLGHVAALIVAHKLSGYMGFVSNLHRPVEEWDIGAVPLMSLMQLELRKGRQKPVIAKALVDLSDKPFQFFASQRDLWRVEDHYSFPGPMQFTEGPKAPLSLRLEETA